MLTELSDLQQSDEELHHASKVSFTIETRSKKDNELIKRTYAFSHAKEWDKWVFYEFEEKRAINTARVKNRDWRRSKHICYSDGRKIDVDIPPEVERELQELLDIDEITLQQ